jgi:PAS domain S-box-containing protein
VTETGEAEATDGLEKALEAWIRNAADSTSSKAVLAQIRTVLDLNRDAIVRKAARAEQRGDQAMTWITLTGTLCALIALSMLFGMAEFLSAPIRALTTGIDRIAQGNYRERIMLDRKDEFGHLADRFNAMAAELEKWETSNLARIMEEKARAEAVIQSLQDASIGFDEQGIILFANQHALDLLNLDPLDIVGKDRNEVERINDLLREVLNATHHGPLKIVKDGREQFYTLEHTPILRSGVRLGTVAVLRNITTFEEKDRAKTHFLATISHELKTPLASTDIGLSLLERGGGLGKEQGEILRDLRKDHQRLVRIVSELLDLAQVETGNIRLSLAEHALDPLIQEALDAVRLQAERKGLLFARRTGGDDLRIKGDADKTVWVLVNILTNAVRHSPQNGVITLETSGHGGSVVLSISDQGPGIPKADVPKLFRRFSTGPGVDHGTGLGLAIAREFMHAMGGDIDLRAADGEGAVFVLTFAATYRRSDGNQ